MKLAAYLRCSTDEQADSGLGIEAQRHAIEKWAGYKRSVNGDIELVWFVDEGYSAKNLKRPAVQQALTAIISGDLDGLVVQRLDRFSRSLRDFVNKLHDLRALDKTIVSVREEFDTSTPYGRTSAHILVTFAELERDLISERTKAGLYVKRRRGERVGGRPPYGYKALEGRLEPVKSEQATLAHILALRASGETLGAITQNLNTNSHRHVPRGARWHTTTVARILKNHTKSL